MEFQNRRAASFIHSGKEWETKTSSRSEIPVWTVSQKLSHLQWRRPFKEIWCRPTPTADFGFPFWQVPYISYVCMLEDKSQDWGMYLFTISYGSNAVDQRSGVGWFSGWIKIFVIYSWYFNAEFWSTWCEDCFSTEQNHPQFSLQKKNQSGGTGAQKQDRFFRGRQICLPCVLPGHRSQRFRRELCRPVHNCSKWWCSGKDRGDLLSLTRIKDLEEWPMC